MSRIVFLTAEQMKHRGVSVGQTLYYNERGQITAENTGAEAGVVQLETADVVRYGESSKPPILVSPSPLEMSLRNITY